MSQAGGVALVDTVRAAGLDRALSTELSRWHKPMARHAPGKVITDLAVTPALGRDCPADVALLRGEPAVLGAVAPDPTVSRTIDALAADAPRALMAIESARAAARARVWTLAGEQAPDHGIDADKPMVIDLDTTLITAHRDNEPAAPTFKRGFGFRPLWSFLDHGAEGTGEPLSCLLRKGNAGSNTAADHIAVVKAALAQLPGHRSGTRPGRRILIRTDGMPVIIRKERPHPGAQLRLTDPDGVRVTAFATNTSRGQLADLELSRSSSPPGCRCSPWPGTTHADGNRNAYGYDCSASPPAWPSTPADDAYTYRPTHPGPNCSHR